MGVIIHQEIKRLVRWRGWPLTASLGLLLVIALVAPLEEGIAIGGDDSFELGKSLLLARDPGLADRMWNDQPWLHTLLTARLFRLLGEHAAIPRVFTLLSTAALLWALWWLAGLAFHRDRGLGALAGGVAGVLYLTAPESSILACSAMIGPPALCWAMVAAAIGLGTSPNRQHRQTLLWVGVGGILACAAHVKLTALIVSPALVASLFVGRPGKSTLTFLAALWGGFVTVFVVIALSSPSFSFQDLWGSHQQARSEYLQASGHENGVELRWLFQVPALLAAALAGLVVSVRRGFSVFTVFTICLLMTAVCIAFFQRPYWQFYLLQLYVPLSLLGGVGIAALLRSTLKSLRPGESQNGDSVHGGHAPLVGAAACAMVALCLAFIPPSFTKDLRLLRSAPLASEDSASLVMREYASRTQWCYARGYNLARAFHAGLMIPPELAVVSKKRFMIGGITEKEVLETVKQYQPEQLLLGSREVQDEQWQQWVQAEYVLVYSASGEQLWVSKTLNPKSLPEKEERVKRFGL